MPFVIFASVLLLLAACDGYRAGFLNAGGAATGTTRGIDEAYAARDACLARNAVERGLAGATVNARARSLALTCASQTDKLIAASSGDRASVAAAIREDTEFRAKGFVMKAPALD